MSRGWKAEQTKTFLPFVLATYCMEAAVQSALTGNCKQQGDQPGTVAFRAAGGQYLPKLDLSQSGVRAREKTLALKLLYESHLKKTGQRKQWSIDVLRCASKSRGDTPQSAGVSQNTHSMCVIEHSGLCSGGQMVIQKLSQTGEAGIFYVLLHFMFAHGIQPMNIVK